MRLGAYFLLRQQLAVCLGGNAGFPEQFTQLQFVLCGQRNGFRPELGLGNLVLVELAHRQWLTVVTGQKMPAGVQASALMICWRKSSADAFGTNTNRIGLSVPAARAASTTFFCETFHSFRTQTGMRDSSNRVNRAGKVAGEIVWF